MDHSKDNRLEALRQWLEQQPALDNFQIATASADASFRRYFRITVPNGKTLIAMDAPPDKEDCGPFIDVTQRLEQAGLRVPHIHAKNLRQGFLLLDDLGEQDYLQSLSNDNVDALYRPAIEALIKLQRADDRGLPRYDAALLQTEMSLFDDWFLQHHLGLTLDHQARRVLDQLHKVLIENAASQPQVFVHRDYHARNLMFEPACPPGIIDYQDAVIGPITYDLVSLLRDCYIAWPQEQVEHWALLFRDHAMACGQLGAVEESTFLRWFDLMGIQRHLKAIGIFSRLNHRDGKSGYLADIPRTLDYLEQVSRRYDETCTLATLIEELDIKARLTHQ